MPVRLRQRVTGIRPNGDLHGGESARIKVFACGPGRLELTLLGKQGLPTRVLVDGQVIAESTIPPGGAWRPSIPTPASADGTGDCVFQLATDGLIGSTRIEWLPDGDLLELAELLVRLFRERLDRVAGGLDVVLRHEHLQRRVVRRLGIVLGRAARAASRCPRRTTAPGVAPLPSRRPRRRPGRGSS